MMLVSGCAASHYTKAGKFGYSDYKISQNVFSVSFQGKNKTSATDVEKMALRRSAEVTLKNGFTHFIILENKPNQTTKLVPTMAKYFSGPLSITRSNITLRIKCFKDTSPADTINANEFLTTNYPNDYNQKPSQ